MVHKLVNIQYIGYKTLRASHCAIRILTGFGAPNSKAAPGSPHSSDATVRFHPLHPRVLHRTDYPLV